MPFSSSRSLARRSISARSIASARSSLSTPRRLNTRTSTIVPTVPGRQLQRGVAHVGGLLAEDGAQQLLFRRHRAFALRRHLADQNVARVHLGADIHDAGLVEVAQRFLADVRDVAGDFLLAELGVARHHLEFLDMDRGEHVIAGDTLGDQDGVFEVVAVPGHEGAQRVAAQRQLAQLGGRAVGDDVAGGHAVAHLHQRTLVDAGALVGAHVLAQAVDIDALGRAVLGGRAHHDARAVDLVDDAGALGDDGGARVARHGGFHAGADNRRVGLDQRHRLTLHVRAHQRAVGVVVLKEGDERRGDRNQLLRRHVDGGDFLGLDQKEVAAAAHGDEVVGELAALILLARRPAPPSGALPPWRRGTSTRAAPRRPSPAGTGSR